MGWLARQLDLCPASRSRSRFVHAFTSAYSVTSASPATTAGSGRPTRAHPSLVTSSARSQMSQQRHGSTSGKAGAVPAFPDLPEATIARLPEYLRALHNLHEGGADT